MPAKFAPLVSEVLDPLAASGRPIGLFLHDSGDSLMNTVSP